MKLIDIATSLSLCPCFRSKDVQAPSGARDVVLLRLLALICTILGPLHHNWMNIAKTCQHGSHGGCTPDLDEVVSGRHSIRILVPGSNHITISNPCRALIDLGIVVGSF